MAGEALRENSLTALRRSFEKTRNGHGALALISGEFGSGKTELLYSFKEYARRTGALSLGVTCSSFDTKKPFSAFRQLFDEAPTLTEAGKRLTRTLSGKNAPALLRMDRRPDIAQRRGEIMAEIHDTLRTGMAGRPLVIAIDDIHHADVATLQGLLYLANRASTEPIMIVLTESTRPLPAHPLFHGELMRYRHSQHLVLEPLSVEEVTRLLAPHVDAPLLHRLVGQFQALTRGNLLLTKALIDDYIALGDPARAKPVFGDAFRSAALALLHRGDASILNAMNASFTTDSNCPSPLPEILGVEQGPVTKLARALTDLVHAQYALDETNRAQSIIRAAMEITKETRAEAKRQTDMFSENVLNWQLSAELPLNAPGVETLTNRERWVALLALQGLTNIDIARRLYITVSTVEQHLTRVYRKLNVRRRTDLSRALTLK